LCLRDLEQRVTVVEVLGEGDRRDALVEQLPQLRLALGQRQVEERLTVELEQVEGVEDEWARALLQLREARPARRVDPADLAVNDRVWALDGLDERLRDVGETAVQLFLVA
jgi:hypothetical protein